MYFYEIIITCILYNAFDSIFIKNLYLNAHYLGDEAQNFKLKKLSEFKNSLVFLFIGFVLNFLWLIKSFDKLNFYVIEDFLSEVGLYKHKNLIYFFVLLVMSSKTLIFSLFKEIKYYFTRVARVLITLKQIDLSKEYYYHNGGILFILLVTSVLFISYLNLADGCKDLLIASIFCLFLISIFSFLKYILIILMIIMSLNILLMKLVFYYIEIDKFKDNAEIKHIFYYSQIGIVITLIFGIFIFVENEISKNYFKSYEKM